MKKNKLPKMFQGAAVVRGLGMHEDELEALEEKSLKSFDATQETFLVIEDDSLGDDSGCGTARCFLDREDAIGYARALAAGNVNQRVLRVSGHTLVVATDNKL
jgi:hypothetical protein